MNDSFIRWFDSITIEDIPVVGGKTAALGEMYQNLKAKNIEVPNGFGITVSAYWHFLKENKLDLPIQKLLENPLEEAEDIRKVGSKIRDLILNAALPESLEEQIIEAYKKLSAGQKNLSVAVRSSATAEDLPDASFAGQQDTYLNVHSVSMLLSSCKQSFASLFTDRAISYREQKKFNHLEVALSICVQRMVRSDLASSGVMFSIDTESGFKDAILINSSYGLGENIVQGAVNPDEFYVFKPTLKAGKRPILQKILGSKEQKLVFEEGVRMVKDVLVPEEEQKVFSLCDDDILQLAHWACEIEEHFSSIHKKHTPMDIEWAKDGITGELFILQARPETVSSRRSSDVCTQFRLEEKGQVLVRGRSVGDRITHGTVRIISQVSHLSNLKKGEILVTDKTDPDWEPLMKHASGIVTNRGGRTCHAAIVSRELGLPAIVGTEDGTRILKDGQKITISCAEGEIGNIYEGHLDFVEETIDINSLQERPSTKIMMNLANPESAFRLSMIPNDGVGLARVEFIINHSVKIHPMALLEFEKVVDREVRKTIETLTFAYEKKTDYFVDKLAQGISMIAAAFSPHDVIVRFSDFKSNEYANLIGGKYFEPQEENPMLGYRGASRYYSASYRPGFDLECKAIHKVRDEMGLKNVIVMVPFCRTLKEAEQVVSVMKENELERGKDGFKVYMMCEVPSNVILAEKFAKYFDGFSIGSNDLTQLTLGVDRDSELLADIFDERDEAVREFLSCAIQKGKQANLKVGLCGQGPSDYPEVASFLVENGIDSISLNPDSVVKTTMMIKECEKNLNPLSLI